MLPCVTFLNCHEVCIMGGIGNEGPLGDVILFDIGTEQVKTVVGNFAGLLAFSANGRGKNCALFSENVAIALVENEEMGKTFVV